jgi:hypothetical protein
LERRFIELSQLRFNAQSATHGIAHGLRPHYSCAHFCGGCERIIDFEAARIPWPHRIVWPVAFETQPLYVRPAISKWRSVQRQLGPRALHEIVAVFGLPLSAEGWQNRQQQSRN